MDYGGLSLKLTICHCGLIYLDADALWPHHSTQVPQVLVLKRSVL